MGEKDERYFTDISDRIRKQYQHDSRRNNPYEHEWFKPVTESKVKHLLRIGLNSFILKTGLNMNDYQTSEFIYIPTDNSIIIMRVDKRSYLKFTDIVFTEKTGLLDCACSIHLNLASLEHSEKEENAIRF